jgi:hypothetical protein
VRERENVRERERANVREREREREREKEGETASVCENAEHQFVLASHHTTKEARDRDETEGDRHHQERDHHLEDEESTHQPRVEYSHKAIGGT